MHKEDVQHAAEHAGLPPAWEKRICSILRGSSGFRLIAEARKKSLRNFSHEDADVSTVMKAVRDTARRIGLTLRP